VFEYWRALALGSDRSTLYPCRRAAVTVSTNSCPARLPWMWVACT